MSELSTIEKRELSWLAKQTEPVWGAHIARGEPVERTALANYVERGLIEQSGNDGYVITQAARDILEAMK